LTSLIFHFAKISWQKNVLMTAQRDFRLGNSLLTIDIDYKLYIIDYKL